MKKVSLILMAVIMLLSAVSVFADADTPLVVGTSPFSQKFSPFYADTAYDQEIVDLVALGLMTTDRASAGSSITGSKGRPFPITEPIIPITVRLICPLFMMKLRM